MNINIKLNTATADISCTIAFKEGQRPFSTRLKNGDFVFGNHRISLYRKNRFYLKYGQKYYACDIRLDGMMLHITSGQPVRPELTEDHRVPMPFDVWKLKG